MTTITIERSLLERLYLYWLEDADPHELDEFTAQVRAALSAPATAPVTAPATAPEPSWHVAPTVPGLWLNSVFMKVEDVEQWHIDCQLHLECARWFGPIPPDGDKP